MMMCCRTRTRWKLRHLLVQLGLLLFLTSASVSSPPVPGTQPVAAGFHPGAPGEVAGYSPGKTIFKESSSEDSPITSQTYYYPSSPSGSATDHGGGRGGGTTTSSDPSFYDRYASSGGDGAGAVTAVPGQFVPSKSSGTAPEPSFVEKNTSPVSNSTPAAATSKLSPSSNLTHKIPNAETPSTDSLSGTSTSSWTTTPSQSSGTTTTTSLTTPFSSSLYEPSPLPSRNGVGNGNGSSDAAGAAAINLHRTLQLWSANGRSTKLNLTAEHESLLRIEPQPKPASQSVRNSSTRKYSPSSLGEISEFLLSSTTTTSTTTSPIANSFTTTLPTTSSLSPPVTVVSTTSSSSKLESFPITQSQRSRTTSTTSTSTSGAQNDGYGAHHQLHSLQQLPSNPINLRPLFETGGEEQEQEHDEVYPPPDHQTSSSSGGQELLQHYLYPQHSPDWFSPSSGRGHNKSGSEAAIDYYTKRRDEPFFNFDSNRRRNFGIGEGDEEGEEEDGGGGGGDSPEGYLESHHTARYYKYNATGLSGNGGGSSKVKIDESLFPVPAMESVSNDNGLADVISRGRIDSVMYVYFGDKYNNNDEHKEEIAGRVIQAVGGVIAAIAQILTVLGATKCIRKGTFSNRLPIHIHVGFALLISNLLLLLAVHATEPMDMCASVAVILHYLHLVIGCWFLVHAFQTYKTLGRYMGSPTAHLLHPDHLDQSSLASAASMEQQQYHSLLFGQRTISSTTFHYCALTWAAPFPFIIITYLISPEGYETHRFCWMSIERGMVLSFIVPIFILIGLNTVLVILSLRYILALRKLWLDPSCGELEEDLSDGRTISSSVIRASAVLLPLLAIMWFLSVVALENPTSIFFQLAAAAANIALSWLVMYFIGDEVCLPDRWCSLFNNSNSNLSSSVEEDAVGEGRRPGSPPSIQPSSSAVQLTHDRDAAAGVNSACSFASQNDVAGPSSSSVIAGPSTSSSSMVSKVPSILGRRSFYKNKPNWSRPGGNELYELRHDAISTICK